MSKQPRWIVTTDGSRPIQEVVGALERAGFAVQDVLAEIGSITGAASEQTIARARLVRGVIDVSPDQPIDLGPPGPDPAW